MRLQELLFIEIFFKVSTKYKEALQFSQKLQRAKIQ